MPSACAMAMIYLKTFLSFKMVRFSFIDSSLVFMLVYLFFNKKCLLTNLGIKSRVDIQSSQLFKQLIKQGTSEQQERPIRHVSIFFYINKGPRLVTTSRCKYQELKAEILLYCNIFVPCGIKYRGQHLFIYLSLRTTYWINYLHYIFIFIELKQWWMCISPSKQHRYAGWFLTSEKEMTLTCCDRTTE